MQALWALSDPLDIDSDVSITEAEAFNRALIRQFGGDAGTHNIDRLLRLPGTVNLPDAKKRARGRATAPAKLAAQSDRRYASIDFAPAEGNAGAVTASVVDIGRPEFIKGLVDLDDYHLPDRVLTIVQHGRIAGETKQPKNSRSEWLFDGVCQLVRFGVPDEVIFGILLDERWGISESVLDKSEHDQHRYATRQIVSAHRRIDNEHIRDFDKAPPPLAPDDRASDF